MCVGCHGRHQRVIKDRQIGGTIIQGGGVQGVQQQSFRRSATASSSGCDSFYNRHSPHRRCYMLKNLPQEIRRTQESSCTISKLNSCDNDKIRKASVLSVQTSTVLLHSNNGHNSNNSHDTKKTINPVTTTDEEQAS